MTRWTDDKVEILKKLRQAGQSAGVIAERLGREFSTSAVIGKAYRLGLAFERPSTPATSKPKAQRPTLPRRPAPAATPRPAAPAAEAPLAQAAPVRAKAFNGLPGSHPRPWLEHLPGLCRWPIDDARGFPSFACCEPVEAEGNYCAPHDRLSLAAGARGMSQARPKASPGRRAA
jgi:GcrA cell cycle regulator